VTVQVRVHRWGVVEDHTWDGVPLDVLACALPWRTFQWHKGQRHYSGAFWSSTQRDHVIYESRLELAVLLSADFDASVAGIVAQPFLLRAEVDGEARRHVPDYLLLTDTGPVMVDVKPGCLVSKPAVAATLAWTRTVVRAVGGGSRYAASCRRSGWRIFVSLPGYRRDWLFDPALLPEARITSFRQARKSR
jgi:hypothetical protein